jgi:hypothetical protein
MSKVRVLVDVKIEGVAYRCNQVVDLPASLAKMQKVAGTIDMEKEAVNYCIEKLGEKVVVHKAAEGAQKEEKERGVEETKEVAGEAGEAGETTAEAPAA